MTTTDKVLGSAESAAQVMPEVMLGIVSGIFIMIIPVAFIGLGLSISGKIARKAESVF